MENMKILSLCTVQQQNVNTRYTRIPSNKLCEKPHTCTISGYSFTDDEDTDTESDKKKLGESSQCTGSTKKQKIPDNGNDEVHCQLNVGECSLSSEHFM